MSSRRIARTSLVVPAAVTAAVLALSACSSGSSSHVAAGGGRTNTKVPAANMGPHDSTGVPKDVGKPANSFSCTDFSASFVQSAISAQLPNAQVTAMPDSSKDAPVDCAYNVYAPGTDTSSADRGEAQVLLKVDDTWDDTPLEDDPAKNLEHEKEQFGSDRQAASTGDSDSSHRTTFSDTTGVGVQAYTETTAQLDESTGQPTQWNNAMSVLNEKQPFKLELSIGYVLPETDNMPKDTSVDTAMRDDKARNAVLDALANAVLAKVK